MRAASIRYFQNNGQYQDVSWDLASVQSGKEYPARTPTLAQTDNVELLTNNAELTLWFQDTNVSVTIPSGAAARIATF